MNILGIDCSATSASAAVVSFNDDTKESKILSSSYTNVGLTHSQTLVPLINGILCNAQIALENVDVFAINVGPGSFTGVRIGVAALKGMTALSEPNCIAVSTLESMAYNYVGVKDCIVCSAMDARCNQVYAAMFKVSGGKVSRLMSDSALLIPEFEDIISNTSGSDIIFVGDGARLCYNTMKEKNSSVQLAPETLLHQNAVSVALCAYDKLSNGEQLVSSTDILPTYLRAPQAERELKKKADLKK